VALHVVDQDSKKEKDERDKVPLRKVVDAIQCCMEQKQYSQVRPLPTAGDFVPLSTTCVLTTHAQRTQRTTGHFGDRAPAAD
jgi:hypothetical protein